MLKKLFGVSELSLRQISQAVHRIGLVLASLPSDRLTLTLATVAALILRTMNENLYQKFITAGVTDLEVVDALFPGGGKDTLLENSERCLFEAAVVIGYGEMSKVNWHSGSELSTPLLKRYKEEIDSDAATPAAKHAKRVSKYVRDLSSESLPNVGFNQSIGFAHSIRRIELFSNELMGDSPSGAGDST